MAVEPSTIAPSLSTPEPPKDRHVIQAAGIMGLFTGASRILGFARDFLIAAAYGTSSTAQAFVVAFRIPNLLRDLAAEGAANSAFVPVFSRTRAVEGEGSWIALAEAIWIRVLLGFLLISLIGMVAAPWAVRLIAPGFHSDPALMSLTIQLTRILFPFIGFIGVAAFFMGLLNSLHRFALPSLGPALLNLCMIAGIFLWRPDALGLAWGVIVGGFLQCAIQWPLLRKSGLRLRPRFTYHPGVSEIQRLLIPRLMGNGVYQASVLVDTIFASFRQLVGAGGVASLYFAHRFLHLPLALFGVSMAQAALPTMASQVATEDLKAVKKTCLLALRSSLFITIPSSVGLVVLGHPIIQTLLERGAFSARATEMTVSALQWYALGLASFCSVKVLANTLYAFHDTWTPVRSAAWALGLNVIFNSLLVLPMGLGGLALATSLSSTFNCFHLYRAVGRRIGSLGQELTDWGIRVLIASLGMGGITWSIWALGSRWFPLFGPWASLAWLLLAILSGIGSFFLLGLLLRIEETLQLTGWVFRKA